MPIDTLHASQADVPLDETAYRRLVQRFDRLWETTTSDGAQREMQDLLRRIDDYEAGRTR